MSKLSFLRKIHTLNNRSKLYVLKENKVVISNSLNGSDVKDMVSLNKHAPNAIIVKNYFPKEFCDILYQNCIGHRERDTYSHEIFKPTSNGEIKPVYLSYGVDKIGVPYNITYNKPVDSSDHKKYYENVSKHEAEYMQLCKEVGNPILKFIRDLNHGVNPYPSGMKKASFDCRPMIAGLIRIMCPNIAGGKLLAERPHMDSLPQIKFPLLKQLSCNIYLKVPKSKNNAKEGSLNLWSTSNCIIAITAEELEKQANPTEYLLKMGAVPIAPIEPEQGDLIIFNTRNPHSVNQVLSDDRMTIQTFIGYQGPNDPLLCWN